jgi:hypothetical protein
MTNPTIRIHNLETDEVIDREMTDKEYKDYKAQQVIDAKILAKREEKAEAKSAAEAKLAALGLTVEDLRALGL